MTGDPNPDWPDEADLPPLRPVTDVPLPEETEMATPLMTVDLRRVKLAEANDLLERWGHYLGPSRRPFGSSSWVLHVGGEPVSVAVGASIVSTTVAGLPRRDVVELARLCTHPDHRWATRPMLRLWREVAARAWPYWPVAAAVAYSANERHEGTIYRFDGWTRHGTLAGRSGGGGGWTGARTDGHVARGPKSLWIWRYPTTEEI